MDAAASGLRVTHALLEGIRLRDRAAIAACFAPDARLRVLTPRALREEQGPGAIADRYSAWIDSLEPFALLAADAEVIADRIRVRYRFRGLDRDKGWRENEHTGYAEVGADGIVALNVSCAGFRPSEPR
ncbi:MAG: hypothetical protein ACRC50_05065 [Gaiella sp.]